MKYFFDTEFVEKPNTIELISIGIVAEDGNNFYAENSEFNLGNCNDEWVRQNVITNLSWIGQCGYMPLNIPKLHMDEEKCATELYGTTASMKDAIIDFIGLDDKPEFWSYYADYDWVVFCWIFGKMINLPKHFPMYCNDLQQEIVRLGLEDKPKQNSAEHNALTDAYYHRQLYNWIFNERKVSKGYEIEFGNN